MYLCTDVSVFMLYMYVDVSGRVKTLERACRSLKNEKTTLMDDLASIKTTLSNKEVDLRDSRTAYREAQEELAKLSDK